MKALTKTTSHKASDDYLDLIRAFPLRAIRSDSDFGEAKKILARLLGRPDGRLSSGQRDYAEVLGRLMD
ncbi:MAG TPA: hypothetical protein VL992_07165, partial [Tepidisphaeraceae bacterium]|nr:hypothetical protein [Tepidisphaeraceae bacterium]